MYIQGVFDRLCYIVCYLFCLIIYSSRNTVNLANPKQKAQEVAANGEYQYTPEMGEQKPDCQIEAQLGYYGEHYYLKTALELKGRGIVREQEAENGKHWYRVTTRAYENLKQIYTISRVMYLD